MTDSRRLRVLFLCTGNSARSILAEHFLRRAAPERFESFSAGSRPRGRVNPLVVEILRDEYGIDAGGARSKSWEELRDVPFDFVITVCDRARESCPVFPGRPAVAHWSSEDPDSGASEGERREIARRVAQEIRGRVERFATLPFESVDRAELERRIHEIGDDASGPRR